MTKLFQEPFRPFFLVGSLFLMLWSYLWMAFALVGSRINPTTIHQTGFSQHALGSFVVGFLLTAWPHFTQTKSVSIYGVATLLLIHLVEGFSLLTSGGDVSRLLSIGKWVLLSYFIVSRWLKARNKPLVSMPWLTAALLGVIVTTLLKTTAAIQARLFLTTLVIAVGSQMIPALCGIRRRRDQVKWGLRLSVLLYVVGLWAEQAVNRRFGLVGQASVLTWVLVSVWQLYKRPERSLRGWGLWLSSWFLAAGYWAAALSPNHASAWLHLTFIGGFVGITMMIVCQVLTAHCDLSGQWLQRFHPLGWILILLVIAALTRVSAAYVSYMQHLGYAAATLLVAAAWLTLLVLQKLKVL